MNIIGFCQNIERSAYERRGSTLAHLLSLRDDHIYNRNLFINNNAEIAIDDNVSNPLNEVVISHLKCLKVSSTVNFEFIHEESNIFVHFSVIE